MKKEKFIRKITEKVLETLEEFNSNTYDVILHPNNEQFIIGVNGNPIYTGLTEEARQYHKENDLKIKEIYDRFFKADVINNVRNYHVDHILTETELQEQPVPLNLIDFNQQYKEHLLELYPNKIEVVSSRTDDCYDFIYKLNNQMKFIYHGDMLYSNYLETNDFSKCDLLITSSSLNDRLNFENYIKPILQDFDTIKNYIYPKLLSHHELLKDNELVDYTSPYKMCFFINLNEINPPMGIITVTKELLHKWEINKNQLKDIAISNLFKDLPQEETEYSWNGNNLVLKNSLVGSAIILNECVREEIIKKLGNPTDYYILSASTPDCIEINTTGIEPFCGNDHHGLFSDDIGIHAHVEQEIEEELE